MKKLTPKQNTIIYCLQNGWALITLSETTWVTCCSDKGQFQFSSSILFRLVDMGLIYQSGWNNNFDFILTKEGQKIKTKPIDLSRLEDK